MKQTYQELFNDTLRDIRLACKATGNNPLADVVIGRLFDFSDNLQKNDIIRKDKDNDNDKNKQPNNY
jgi:hypothetical protein